MYNILIYLRNVLNYHFLKTELILFLLSSSLAVLITVAWFSLLGTKQFKVYRKH